VWFDFFGNGQKIKIPWTDQDSNNAWLVLDRNHNGVIDDASEMFGNLTPQPPCADPNGFRALAEYDKPENGGNGDGVIDKHDRVFSSLRLWIDKNYNGISEPDELFTLPSLGVDSIYLDYYVSSWVDEFGNIFRYRGFVEEGRPTPRSYAIYDVFLIQTAPDSGPKRIR
jgi:hypothetical protein